MAEENDGNGRVTIAILGQRLERVERVLDRMEAKLDGMSHDYQSLCLDVNTNQANLKNIREDVDALEKKSNLVDTLTGTGAVVAAILGALGLTRS